MIVDKDSTYSEVLKNPRDDGDIKWKKGGIQKLFSVEFTQLKRTGQQWTVVTHRSKKGNQSPSSCGNAFIRNGLQFGLASERSSIWQSGTLLCTGS